MSFINRLLKKEEVINSGDFLYLMFLIVPMILKTTGRYYLELHQRV